MMDNTVFSPCLRRALCACFLQFIEEKHPDSRAADQNISDRMSAESSTAKKGESLFNIFASAKTR